MDVTPSDYLHIVTSVVIAAATIATLKTDIRWIKQWCRDHKKSDDDCFKDVRSQIAELRRNQRHSPHS